MNEAIQNYEEVSNYGMGWTRDNPDYRDYTVESDKVVGLLSGLKLERADTMKLNPSADLRAWCSPIENQGSLGSCTANAGVGILEYFERRAFGTHIDASRLF